MKIVINSCYGGFGLSPLALKELAKLKGKEIWFFRHEKNKYYEYDDLNSGVYVSYLTAFTTNDLEFINSDKFNYFEYRFNEDDYNRNDLDLVSVVEKLGPDADGRFAELKIVEIPDDIEWHVVDCGGIECVDENHRSWS